MTMPDTPDLDALQAQIGCKFDHPEVLLRALTHSSRRADLADSNERLEFLGDAVLGLVVSDRLFRLLPDQTEGQLTRVKSVVVSRPVLARAARRVQLNQFLLVGKGVGGRESVPSSLLANAFEAVLGAVFLDLGMDAARDFALRVLEEDVQEVLRDRHEPNYKSVLQHYAQKNMNATPTYRVRQEVGPDHLKSFTVVALLNGVEHGIGTGSTKKEAEQSAAAETLRQLGVAPPDDAGPPAAHGPQF